MKKKEENIEKLQESTYQSLPDATQEQNQLLSKKLEEGIRPISSELSAKWYELYLAGYDYGEIQKTYPQHSLGDVLWCAWKYGWFNKKNDYTRALQNRVAERMAQVRFEIADHVLDLMKVHDVMNKDAVKKYIADPDNNPLPPSAIKGTRQFKDLLDVLEKITTLGQPIKHEVEVLHTGEISVAREKQKETILAELVKEIDDMTENE